MAKIKASVVNLVVPADTPKFKINPSEAASEAKAKSAARMEVMAFKSQHGRNPNGAEIKTLAENTFGPWKSRRKTKPGASETVITARTRKAINRLLALEDKHLCSVCGIVQPTVEFTSEKNGMRIGWCRRCLRSDGNRNRGGLNWWRYWFREEAEAISGVVNPRRRKKTTKKTVKAK